jgi:hypothetical protein
LLSPDFSVEEEESSLSLSEIAEEEASQATSIPSDTMSAAKNLFFILAPEMVRKNRGC